MFYIYVIQNNLGKIYIGQTEDIETRLARHNKILPSKKTSFTARQGKNWKLVYTEEFTERKEAIKREKELKSYQGRLYIKRIIEDKDR